MEHIKFIFWSFIVAIIGLFMFIYFNAPETPDYLKADAPRTAPRVDYTNCELVPRPVEHTIIGTISTGSDCKEDLVK